MVPEDLPIRLGKMLVVLLKTMEPMGIVGNATKNDWRIIHPLGQ